MFRRKTATSFATKYVRRTFQAAAGKSLLLVACFLALTTTCFADPSADFNNDGMVAFADFLILSQNYGQPGLFADGDANLDGQVDFTDFLILSGQFNMDLELHGIWNATTKELHIYLNSTYNRAVISTDTSAPDPIIKLESLDHPGVMFGVRHDGGMATTVKASSVEKLIVHGSGVADVIDLSGIRTNEFTSMRNYPFKTRDVDKNDVDGDGDTSEYLIFADVEIYGNAGDDTITGSRFHDFIDGGPGADSVATHGGPEILQQGLAIENLNRTASTKVSGNIYVDSTVGSDHNSGSSTSPLWSIQAAVNLAGPNTTIWVEGGRTYPTNVILSGKTGLTIRGRNGIPVIDGETISNNHVHFFNDPQKQQPLADEPAASVIWLPPDAISSLTHTVDPMIDWALDGSGNYATRWVSADGMLIIQDCNSIVVRDLKIQNSRHAGISIRNYQTVKVDNIEINSCEIVNTRGHGIIVDTVDANSGTNENITIKNCKLSRVCEGFAQLDAPSDGQWPASQGEAISVSESTNVYIHGNEITLRRKEGIDLKQHVTNAHVYNNYIGPRAVTPYGTINGPAIYLDPGKATAPVSKNIEIYRNLMDGDGTGIQLGSERGGHMEDIRIYNNLVNTAGNCFKISDFTNPGVASGDKKHVHVYHNTFVNFFLSTTQHVCFIKETDHQKLEGLKFKNNIVGRDYSTTTNLFAISDDPNSVVGDYLSISHNVFWRRSTPPGEEGSNAFSGDPNFTTVSINIANQSRSVDYGIGANGVGFNSAINLGTVPNLYLDFDIALEPRPSTGADIGAFENQ